MSLSIFFELGLIIALPVALLAFGGAYADKTLGTAPLLMLLGMGAAAVISSIGVWRKIQRVQRTEFGDKRRP